MESSSQRGGGGSGSGPGLGRVRENAEDSADDDRDSHSDSGSEFTAGRRKSVPRIHRAKNYPTGTNSDTGLRTTTPVAF